VAIPKVVGIETEYGIMVRGTDEWNPISASSLLINAYVGSEVGGLDDRSKPVSWDFTDEMPGSDAREFLVPEFAMPPEIETHLVNAVLTNGARYYVDHAHPEISTPECRNALSVVLFDRAAELIAVDSMVAADKLLPEGQSVILYKDNSDRKGNSYGCHENYLLDRHLPFGEIVHAATIHFVTRQIFTGSGKVGSELPGGDWVDYQLTQRADHFEEEVGLETTLKRPIVNTRDEPHADSQLYRRLHVIVGDANMSQVATFLKVGTSSILFAMAEDREFTWERSLAHPVLAMHQVSHDLTLELPLEFSDGSRASALQVQFELLESARKWAKARGLESVGGEEVGNMILDRWEQVLTGLEADPASVASSVDWVAKLRLIDGFRERHDCAWRDSRLRALDLQYHDMRPGKSLAARAGLETLVSDSDAEIAKTEPPTDTRAYFRGKCLQRFPESVVAANWDSMVFDVGDDPLRRVPMLEPIRGTAEHVGTLIDESKTAAELLDKLGA
jgi:proteasome accessory factor PafA2